jgi:hypothetical protein
MRDAPTLSAALTALLLIDSSLDKYGLPWYSLLLLSLLLIMPCVMSRHQNITVRMTKSMYNTQGRLAHTTCLLLLSLLLQLAPGVEHQSSMLSAHTAC